MNESMQRLAKYAVVVAVLLAVGVSWWPQISKMADGYVDDGLKRSLISFASARALNGVISVLQGTELAVQPFGFGVTITVGEILDPVNDLVESFSSVMLIASVAFGIQKVLLLIGGNWAVSAILTAIAVAWIVLYWLNRSPPWLYQLLGVLLFIRFVMPVATIGSAKLFEAFSAEEYRTSQGALDKTTNELKMFVPSVESAATVSDQSNSADVLPAKADESSNQEVSIFGRVGEAWRGMKGAVSSTIDRAKGTVSAMRQNSDSVKRKYEDIKKSAESAVERMIKLIVIFLMQTVIVPILLLLGLFKLSKEFFKMQPDFPSTRRPLI